MSIWCAGEHVANNVHPKQTGILSRGKEEYSVFLNYSLGLPFIGHEPDDNNFESILYTKELVGVCRASRMLL
jgi:hypothetical protein